MIIDVCAHAGPWTHRPIGLETHELMAMLGRYDVSVMYYGRLEALWYENPHAANSRPYPGPGNPPKHFVPVLDPTVATWPQELQRLLKHEPTRMVRLYPNYHRYALAEADALLAALAERKLVAQVMVRMEDPRRQHRLAQVADVPAADVLDAAGRHPELAVLLSGASGPDLRSLASRLPRRHNLWADTSQADGAGLVAALMDTAWRDRLVFGSHAPLFTPHAALTRVVLDLDDEPASRVLETNPRALLNL